MTLIKTSILTSISTTIRILIGFIVIKVISVYLGPSGLALLAQVQNFINIVTSLSSSGITTGIVKYTSEYKTDKNLKIKIWGNAIKISLTLAIVMSIFIALFSVYISKILLNSQEYKFVFLFFSITLVFFALNGIFIAILNGLGKIKKLTFLNISASLINAVITVLLVYYFSLKGALISTFLSQLFIFFIFFAFIFKEEWFTIQIFLQKIEKDIFFKFVKYSSMMIIATVLNMSALIFLRNYIGDNLGWNYAGYWQGVWKISETYLMFITGVLSVYYLPKLSGIFDKKELHKEILYVYKMVLPVVVLLSISIYIFRDFIIKIIFTEEFAPMSELFLYQLLGDVVKIASWLIGFILIAKAKTLFFIIKEIFLVFLFITVSTFLIKTFGIIGVVQGFLIENLVNFLILIVFYKNFVLKEIKPPYKGGL